MKKKNAENDCITTEIGRMWLTMENHNGKYTIGFQTSLVDSGLDDLLEFTHNTLDIELEPDRMFNAITGDTLTMVSKKIYNAVRKWIANNTDWQFVRKVDDSDLIEKRK